MSPAGFPRTAELRPSSACSRSKPRRTMARPRCRCDRKRRGPQATNAGRSPVAFKLLDPRAAGRIRKMAATTLFRRGSISRGARRRPMTARGGVSPWSSSRAAWTLPERWCKVPLLEIAGSRKAHWGTRWLSPFITHRARPMRGAFGSRSSTRASRTSARRCRSTRAISRRRSLPRSIRAEKCR